MESGDLTLRDILRAQNMQIAQVISQLEMSNESGALPGDKIRWCIDKLSNAVTVIEAVANGL